MTMDEVIASGWFDLPDEPGMVRIPVSIDVMIPNHILFPSRPPEEQHDPDGLYDMVEDDSGYQPWHAAAAVTQGFGMTIGPVADAEEAAFRKMLKVIQGGRGQGVPTLPVVGPVDTTDVSGIVASGAQSGDASGKPPAAAEVARQDAVPPASGDTLASAAVDVGGRGIAGMGSKQLLGAASVNLGNGVTSYSDAPLAGRPSESSGSATYQDNSDNPPVPELGSSDGGDPGSPGAVASVVRAIFGDVDPNRWAASGAIFGGTVGAGLGGTGGAAAGALEGGVEGGLIGSLAGPPGVIVGGSAAALAGGATGAIAGAAGGGIIGAGFGATVGQKLGNLVVHMEGSPASPTTGQPTDSSETTANGEIDPGSSKRGLTFVGENLGVPRSPAMQAARDFESATEGASSDVATRQRQVPALRYDNPNSKGVPYVKFDGFRLLDDGTTELIDAKMRIVPFSTADGPFISDSVRSGLARQTAALEQNPGYRGLFELPTEPAAAEARYVLKRLDIENISVRLRPSTP